VDDRVEFVAYDKTGAYQQKVIARSSSTVLPVNEVPTSTLDLNDNDPALAVLLEKGARCAYRFRGEEWFRGRVGPAEGVGGKPDGVTSLTVEGDFRKLWDWQGWQKPTAILTTTTTVDQEYARYSGTTEAVWRAALVANFTRLGVPWTVAPNLGRGKPNQRVEFRMHPLAEKLLPLLNAADLIAELSYHPMTGAVTVSLREAETVPGKLTEKSGVIGQYEWNRQPPPATRGVVGGAGEGPARVFLQWIDEDRETDWADIIETFTDARMAKDGASLAPDAEQAQADTAARVGVKTDLMETDRFRFGETFLVGDRVPVELGRFGQVDYTERITQVQIDDTPENGVVVTPRLGELDNSADAELGAEVARLARGVRDQGRR
jgi:head-tail adaptor